MLESDAPARSPIQALVSAQSESVIQVGLKRDYSLHAENSMPVTRGSRALRNLIKAFTSGMIIVIYFVVGCLIYTNTEGWTVIFALYFQMVTISTVGYGDNTSSTIGMKYFTLIWFFFGMLLVFSTLSRFVGWMSGPLFALVSKALDNFLPKQTAIDIDGDGNKDFYLPRGRIAHYSKELLPAIVVSLVVRLMASIFYCWLEGWTYAVSFYFSMITATTIGFGDYYPETEGGQLFCSFHIIMSVALIATTIAEADKAKMKRKKQVEKLRIINGKLNHELILSLDRGGGEGVDKLEFVIGMIVKLEMLEWSEVEPFMKQFDQLDLDKSGVLDKADLERAAVLTATKLGDEKKDKLISHAGKLAKKSSFIDGVDEVVASGVMKVFNVSKIPGLGSTTQNDLTAPDSADATRRRLSPPDGQTSAALAPSPAGRGSLAEETVSDELLKAAAEADKVAAQAMLTAQATSAHAKALRARANAAAELESSSNHSRASKGGKLRGISAAPSEQPTAIDIASTAPPEPELEIGPIVGGEDGAAEKV